MVRIDHGEVIRSGDFDEARGRGHLHSDDEGRYWFWTVQPEAYPIPTDGPVGNMLAATSRSPVSRYSPGDLSVLTRACSGCWSSMTPACRRSSPSAHRGTPTRLIQL